jgi:hypothetical protein
MKTKCYAIYFIPLLMLLLTTCGKKGDHTGHDHDHDTDVKGVSADAWPQMDNFHFVMAEVFHPYKDSANLQPARIKAPEMARAADLWVNEPLPGSMDTKEMRQKLTALKTGTAAFVETVKSGSDAQIAQELTALHDLFHEIQEAWYGTRRSHHH